MLSRMSERGCCMKEGSADYEFEQVDFDPDSDFDFEETKSNKLK
jgi:hypothetical protein